MSKKFVFAGIGLMTLSLTLLVADDGAAKLPPASDRKNVTYEKDIKPIFDKSCVKCHGGEKPRGKLNMSTLEGVLKGGKDGKIIKPGNSTDSFIMQAIDHSGEPDDWMPPMKNKAGIGPLTKEQVALVRVWIDQGAK